MPKIKIYIVALVLLALTLAPLAIADNPSCSAGIVSIENIVDPVSDVNTNSFVITSPQGIKIFLDITSLPQEMEGDAASPDNLVIITHTHADHYNGTIGNGFKGKKLIGSKGSLVSEDVKIEGIESSHSYNSADGTDIIYVMDVAGIRIAAFGDCGQSALKPAQLEKLGRIDLAFCQFENMYSQADTANKKLYKLMAQVDPVVIIPTHIFSDKAIKMLNESWPVEAASKTKIAVDANMLAKGKRAIFLGKNAALALKVGMTPSKEF